MLAISLTPRPPRRKFCCWGPLRGTPVWWTGSQWGHRNGQPLGPCHRPSRGDPRNSCNRFQLKNRFRVERAENDIKATDFQLKGLEMIPEKRNFTNPEHWHTNFSKWLWNWSLQFWVTSSNDIFQQPLKPKRSPGLVWKEASTLFL